MKVSASAYTLCSRKWVNTTRTVVVVSPVNRYVYATDVSNYGCNSRPMRRRGVSVYFNE